MNDYSKELIVDTDYRFLIQPLSKVEYDRLAQNISSSGCKSPITIWQKTIIDGHNRYEICKQQNIPFETTEADFEDRSDALIYICKTQLCRSDLTQEYWKYLIGRLYQAYTETLNTRRRSYRKYDIAKKIGEQYNISYATVLKYDVYTKAIDAIREKEPEISAKLLMDQIRISHENIIEISRLTRDDLKHIKNILFSKGMERISYSEIRYELQWQRLPVFPKNKQKTNMPIHKMPEYDPDAELSSLALTIPSWISTTERVNSQANFAESTPKAKAELSMQLDLLKSAIDTIKNSLGREKDD